MGGAVTSPTITTNWKYKGGKLQANATSAGSSAFASTTFKSKLWIGSYTERTDEVLPVKSVTSQNGNGLQELDLSTEVSQNPKNREIYLV